MLDNLNVMILAGGYGTRLNSVVADRPKALAVVKGRPFLSYVLDQLSMLELRSVIICSGYKGEMIFQTFQNRYKDMELIYSQEQNPLGTAGALRLALEHCTAEYLMVMNGDSYCDADIASFLKWHYLKRADCSILLAYMANTLRFGSVQSDEEGKIEAFEEKGREGSGWINAGIYIIRREIIASLPVNRMVSLEREVFPHLTGNRFYGFKSYGSFIDIGTPDSYRQAGEFFANKFGDKGSEVIS
jgi:D-glycero-alpha-D-manno-heptose 1-phosphate guanylyltransferase